MIRILLLLIVLFAGTATAAQAQWHEATTPRLRVYATGEAQARRVAERLERLDAAMRALRGIEAVDAGPAARLTVYVVNSAAQMTKMSGPNVGGFYRPRASGSVAYVPSGNSGGGYAQAEMVLFHEYAHHFLYRNAPGAYPTWFSEGFAEFHGTAKIERDGAVMFGHAPVIRAHGILMNRQLPIERLLEPGSTRMNIQEADNLYGRGWMLTHLLTFSQKRSGQLKTYIAAIRAGQDSVAAARSAFGDLTVLDDELDDYARHRLSGLRVPGERLSIPPIAIRQLPPAESAVMPVHLESTAGVTLAQAKALLPRARRLAAPHPDNAFAQGVLAEAEYDAGNLAEARDAALRAIAADPKSRQGHVYHGMALAALAEAAKDDSVVTYRGVIAPWQRANRLDPDDPLPMVLIYHTANRFGQHSPAIVKAIQYARALAPEDRELSATAAYEYLRGGDTAIARDLIASIAYNPHAGDRERMASVLALIDAGKAREAIAVLAQQDAAGDDAKAGGTAAGE